MTYTEFEKNFASILRGAGYDSIHMPAYEPWKRGFCLWGKISGAMAYFYAVYETDTADMAAYTGLKELIDQRAAAIAARFDMRHTVVFNIFAGDLSKDVRSIEKMIDSQGEFTMMAKYDVYYGADTAGLRILRNKEQPHNMDGALTKIERALKGKDVKDVPSEKKLSIIRARPTGYAVPVAKRPILCYTILAINAAIFLLMELSGGSTDTRVLIEFGAVSGQLVLVSGEYWRLLTSNFIHIGFMHLLFNTAFLIIMATRAERYFGHVKFAIIYIISGVLSGVSSIIINNEWVVSAGASGALFGVIGALVAFTVLRRQQIENLNIRSLVTLIVVNVVLGFAINQFPGGPNIGNAAHIGGLVAGLGLGYVLAGKDMSTHLKQKRGG